MRRRKTCFKLPLVLLSALFVPCFPTVFGQQAKPACEKTDHKCHIEYYSDRIGLHPNEAKSYVERGQQFVKLGLYKKAINDFTSAIEFDRLNANAHHWRAYVYGILGDIRREIADYSKAIELDPIDATNFNNRAFCYQKIGENENAKADFDRAIELSPNDSQLYFNRGTFHLKNRNKAQSDADFAMAKELQRSSELKEHTPEKRNL